MRRPLPLLFGAVLAIATAGFAEAAPLRAAPTVLNGDGPAAQVLQVQTSNENYAIMQDRWYGGYSHYPRSYHYPPAYSYYDYDPYPRYRVYRPYRPYHYYPYRYHRGPGITLQFSF
jgi:hypothetical protein